MTPPRRTVARLSDGPWLAAASDAPQLASDVLRPHPAVLEDIATEAGLVVRLTDTRTGLVHDLNLSASAVWVLLDGATPLGQVADEVADAFALPAATASDHVRQAARQFWDAGLLDGSPPPPEPEPVTGCSSCG